MRDRSSKNKISLGNSDSIHEIKRKTVRGGFVTIISQIARTLLQFISAAILGRMLLPEDFGMIAMVMAISNLAAMIGELGLSAVTIQKEKLSQNQVSIFFWINTSFGFITTVILIVISPLISFFYQDPRLLKVSVVLSCMFFFSGLSVQHRAILSRNLMFGTIGIVEVGSYFTSILFAILAAYKGLGYWALVIMYLSYPILQAFTFLIFTPWKPSLPKKEKDLKQSLGFGGHVTIHSIINYFSRNADNVLIGRILGSEMLGYYSRAYSLMMLPIRQIRTPLISVGLPALSRLQRDHTSYSEYYIRLTTVIAFFAIPLILFIGIYADEVIFVLLGPGWEKAAQIFKILSVAGAIQTIVGTNGMVMLSSGNSERFMKFGIVTGIFTVLSFILGLPWGIKGVAASYVIFNIITIVPQLLYTFKNTPVIKRDFFKEISYPVFGAIISIYIPGYFVQNQFTTTPLITIVIGLVVSIFSYILLFIATKLGRKQISMISKNIKNLIKKS